MKAETVGPRLWLICVAAPVSELDPEGRASKMNRMKTLMTLSAILVASIFAAALTPQTFAQETNTPPGAATSPVAAPAGQPNPQELLKQMIEMSTPNENHQLHP